MKSHNTFRTPISYHVQNVLNSFNTYAHKLKALATYDNSTILPNTSVMLLNHLTMFQNLKGTPDNLMKVFAGALPFASFKLRSIVATQRNNIGELTNDITGHIKCIEHSLTQFLKYYLLSGGNLANDGSSDFASAIKCLQKLVNTVASIGDTILNNYSLSTNEASESMIILSIVANHCACLVQGIAAIIATINYSKMNEVPHDIVTYLNSLDELVKNFTDSFQSFNNVNTSAVQGLLRNVVRLNSSLNDTLKSVLGIVTGAVVAVDKISENLLGGVSSLTMALG